MADKLIVEMILDPKLDSSGKKKVEKESGQVGKKSGSKFENEFKKETKNLGSGLKASLAGLGTAIAAVGVGRLISQSIDLAKRQEDAINSLNVALQITGKFSQAASQQIQDLASDIQKSTRFGDEELLETAALIQQLGDLTVKDLGEATRATADFAAALRIDLRSAATLVGKAAAGEIGSFSRYGVVIEKGKNNAETFSNTLTKLNSKFGGAAAGQVNTFSGAVDQLGNTFGDTLEELGFFITQNETLIEGLKGGLGFLNDFAGGLKGIRIGLFGIGNASTELGKVDQEIAKIADKISEISKNKSELNPDSASYFFGGSFEKDTARLDGWIAAREVKLKALLERRKEILKTSESENSGGGGNDDDSSNLLSKTQLLAQVKLQNDERIKESALAREQALTELNQRGLISDQEFATSFIAIETEKTNLLAELDRKKEQSAINASENISGAFVAAAKNSKQTASQIGATLNTLATRGFGNAFRTIGAALANGENINKAFIGSVKNTVSEVASAFGDYYIKLGVATLASPNPAGGAAMIAGGAGLKLLSGALGASGGGGGGGGASAVSGQVGFGSDFSDTGAIEQQDVERRDPNTNVEIVVQGSLVQQEELGLFITETLNESFGKQGVSLNDARFA
jgi:SOS response regulatory protein OraA/RecX/F0F1-type ATP synthase membrane subunit c/vacuolar-type H+-ATPase subunit K